MCGFQIFDSVRFEIVSVGKMRVMVKKVLNETNRNSWLLKLKLWTLTKCTGNVDTSEKIRMEKNVESSKKVSPKTWIDSTYIIGIKLSIKNSRYKKMKD